MTVEINKNIDSLENNSNQAILNKNIAKYRTMVSESKKQYKNFDLAKKRAGSLKHRIINNLDKYLVEFEANFSKRGGKVIWALDSEQALEEIHNIIIKHNANSVIKSRSSVCKEVGLNQFLKEKNIELLETNIGDFIINIFNEATDNFSQPLINKSKEDISRIFQRHFNQSKELNSNEIVEFIRHIIRDSYLKADIGITGANYLIADIGAIVLSENEGNVLNTVSFPKIQIAIVGIEKLIPSLLDLDLLIPLNSVHSTGQKINAYNTILTGPKQDNEIDGPIEMYVILLDNNRSEVLSKKDQRRALSCIKCGACLSICPVYKLSNKKSTSFLYSGPIGAVITPHLNGLKEFGHLSYASTLCGKCTEVCPVNIPLHELIIHNRNDIVKGNDATSKDKALIWSWKKIILNRKLMNLNTFNLKNRLFKLLYNKSWGLYRELPVFKSKNFNQLWKEKKGIK